MGRTTLRGMATLLGVAAAIIGASTAIAASAPVISVGISTVGIYDNYAVSMPGTANPDGTYSLSGIGYGTDFNCDWSITANTDPSISGAFNLTNLSTTAQTFVLTVSLPTSLAGPTVMGGSFGDVTYTDTGGAGANAATPNSTVTIQTIAGSPFYRALVDGVGVQDMGSFNLTAFGGPGATGTINQQAFGVPIPSAPGPGSVAANIGIRVTFNLTSGDSANIPVFFRIEAARTPEPASLALVGLGLAALAIARKRI
jgi:hypothetical protein